MNKISIVVPCYNEEASIPIFYKVIEETLKSMKIDYELIFIDDGSKDKTLEILKNIKDKHVKYISFSRNFGKEAAIYAGLNECSGDFVATMDADLQDPPSLIPIMYETLKKEDFDCIGTRRVTRKGEPKIRSFFARMFYKIINKISNVEMVDGARDFRLMTRQMVDSILSLKEYNRYSKGIFSFVGFKTKWLEYENIERVAGETKWSFFKLFIYAIEGIVAFSNFPLIISIIFSTLSFVSSIILLIIMIINGFKELLVILSILLFIFSLLFLILGIIGVYVGKIILEVRKRPIYVVRESNLRWFMDIQNLFKKKFVMLDANDTSIKEKDNMFDNVIDNKFINALFEKYNIPAKYRYFIFENKFIFDDLEFVTDISVKMLPISTINNKGEEIVTYYLDMNNYAFVYVGSPKVIFENELKEFFDEMEKDNILENYFLMMNYIFGKLYYSKQGAHFKHNTIKKANNKILSLKK